MKSCYLFDFDGTLVDSMPNYIFAMLRILNENRISYNEDIIKIVTPLGLNGAARYFINELCMDSSEEEIVRLLKEYMFEAYLNSIPAKPNVIPVLNELKKRGASLNILTASPHLTLDACLKRLGMWELFDNIWSCDDFSTTKADPKIYFMAAEKLGTTVDKILFLDDNLNADTTAKSAGMKVCGVYDDSSKDCTEKIKAATDFYINDFIELPDIEF